MDDIAIDVRDLRKTFGTAPALRGVSLRVRRGEMVALLGASSLGVICARTLNQYQKYFEASGARSSASCRLKLRGDRVPAADYEPRCTDCNQPGARVIDRAE